MNEQIKELVEQATLYAMSQLTHEKSIRWGEVFEQKFAELVAAKEREAIMKSIEELNPVENNPLLQNKPAAFWIENFRQIVYARGTT